MLELIAFFFLTLFYLASAFHSVDQWRLKDLVNASSASRLDKLSIVKYIWIVEHEFTRGKMGMRFFFHLCISAFYLYAAPFNLLSALYIIWLNLLGTAYHDHFINLFRGLNFFHKGVADNEKDNDLFWNKIMIPRLIIIALLFAFWVYNLFWV